MIACISGIKTIVIPPFSQWKWWQSIVVQLVKSIFGVRDNHYNFYFNLAKKKYTSQIAVREELSDDIIALKKSHEACYMALGYIVRFFFTCQLRKHLTHYVVFHGTDVCRRK